MVGARAAALPDRRDVRADDGRGGGLWGRRVGQVWRPARLAPPPQAVPAQNKF